MLKEHHGFSWLFIVKCKDRNNLKMKLINKREVELKNLEISVPGHVVKNEKECSGENMKGVAK